MAVRDRTFIMDTLKRYVGDSTDDETLSIIEDFNDTLDDYDSRSSTDWESKYRENDESWRRKYRERFFGNPDAQPGGDSIDSTPDYDTPAEEEVEKSYRYEDLFEEEKRE